MRLHHVLFAGGLLAVPLSAQTPRASVLLDTNSPSGVSAVGHSVGTDGTLSAVVWRQSSMMYASVSDEDGVLWSSPLRVDDAATGAASFSGFDNNAMPTAVHGDHIYTAWYDERNGINGDDVYFARSSDSGASWEANIRIEDNFTVGDTPVRDFIMVVAPDAGGDPDQDIIHILMGVDVGTGGTFLEEQIFLATSTDGGASFGSAVSVSTENGTGTDVDFISAWAEGQTLHVMWQDDRAGGDDDIFYRRSDDAGNSWAFDEIQLDSSGPLNGDADFEVSVRSQGSVVVASWQEELGASTEQLRVAVSTDGGDTWGADVMVGSYTANLHDVSFSIADIADNGNLVATWHDDRTGMTEVYTASSTDNGATWTDQQVSTGGGAFPRLVACAGSVSAAFWTGNCTMCGGLDDEARAAYSLDFGETWQPDLLISDTANDTDFAEFAYNDTANNFIMTWRSDAAVITTNNIYAGGFGAECVGGSTFRNAGSNPVSLTGNEPWVGGVYRAELDLTTTGHNLGVIVGYATPLTFPLGGGQTILTNITDAGGELLAQPVKIGPVAEFSINVPVDLNLCNAGSGATVSVQGVHIGGVTPFALSNALDVVLSSFVD